jgi:DNA-binding MarR family transcriptional regulator
MKNTFQENVKRLDDLMIPMMHLMHRFVSQASKDEDFTIAQFKVLMMVWHSGPTTVKQLQERLSIAQSTASEMVDRLVHQGWMERKKDPEDRRVTVFSLTDKAIRFLREKKTQRLEVIEKLLQPLSQKEQRQFLDSLEMILKKHTQSDIHFDAKGYYEN